MADTIIATNYPKKNILETSGLDADANAGQNQIDIENTDNFPIGCILRIGSGEKAEIGTILSYGGGFATLTSNLLFKHLENEPVVRLFGSQIKFYRAIASASNSIPDDSLFITIATVTIQADELTTSYSDPGGGSGYWYKYTFLNPAVPTETDLASSNAVRGGNYGHYSTVKDIRREAGFDENDNVLDIWISDARDDAESQVKGALSVAGYTLPLTQVPPIIRNIVKKIAAGNVLLQDYGAGAEGTNKEGKAKIDYGERLLDKIMNKDIVLVDIEQTTEQAQTDSIEGFPNDEDPDPEDETQGFMFTRDQDL